MKKDLKKIKKCSINIYSGNNIYKREGFFMLKNIKKVIISLIAIFLVVSVTCTAFATDITEDELGEFLNEIRQEGNVDIAENENVEQIPEGTNNNATLNTNSNVNENLPETTPYAGIGDYSGLIFVAVFAVSAVYAYKKVKEYNA